MSKIKYIFRDNMNEYIDKIKKDNPNVKFYSISKINNFKTCKRGYYYTYINKKSQKQGVYGLLGSACHSDLEELYENKEETKLKPINFNKDWFMAETFGINFPSDKIKENYKKDIDNHYKIYKKREGKFISELGFLLKVDEDHYLMGYIDLIEILDEGNVKVYDFKTSAKFQGDKIVDAGRQLAVYQMALEQLYDMDVISNGWEMLKYVEIQIGSNKPRVISSREWVEKCKTQIKTLMKKNKMDTTLIEIQLSKCCADNSIELLSKEIQDQIHIETYFVPYAVTEEVKKETINYILNNIKKIESMNIEDEEEWQPCVNQFFCKNLCSFGGTHCRYWEIK